jgi:hypothetical protein
MNEEAYPEPLVVELPAACPGLARLPRLPVRVLVLGSPGLDEPGRRGLADRLRRLAEDVGAADGVVVQEQTMAGRTLVPGSTERLRFDLVILRPAAVPASKAADDAPAPDVVDSMSRVLSDLQTRFWVLDPSPNHDDPDDDVRRMKLCRRLVERGAPPVVVVPPGWTQEELAGWHVDFLEHALADAPLAAAVARATGSLRPVPAIFQPTGGRFGLDLGRLLEDHRQRIGEASSELRIFEKELEAAEPGPAASAAQKATWDALTAAAGQRHGVLELVRGAVDEINRDRDPAGWSRLGANVAQLRALDDGERAARDQLQALRLIARDREASG